MARARNIKPGFFQNEQVGELTPITRLAFIGMWTIADFKGCIEFRPKRLKIQLLPYDNCNLEEIAFNLDKSGLIRMYSVQGQLYIKIVNFEKHQNPHKNERDGGSDIPDYTPEASIHAGLQNIQINREQDGTTPADSLFPLPSSLNPETITPPIAGKPLEVEYPPEFDIVWNIYPKKSGASKKAAYKAWNARLKAGAIPDQIVDGVVRYIEFISANNTEPKYIKNAETFFGPDDHYKSDWTPHKNVASGASQLGRAGQVTAAAAQRLIERMENEQTG